MKKIAFCVFCVLVSTLSMGPAHAILEESPTCVVIIDEDGIDNNMASIEKAAPLNGISEGDNDYLVNDKDWLGMFGYAADDPQLFPEELVQQCEDNGLPSDRKLPTECGNPAFLWNLLVRDGLSGPADGAGQRVLLPTGQVDDEAYFALPPVYEPTGGIRYADERPAECDTYLHDYDQFVSDFTKGVVPQACLDKVRDVVPLRNQDLVELVGKTCVAIVYDSDINMDYEPQYANLQGERHGAFSFKVEMVELPALGRAIPESTSDTDLYNLWLQVLPPQLPKEPFLAKKHDHEPDSIQIVKAVYDNEADKLIVVAESSYGGGDNTAPYFPLDQHPTTFSALLSQPLIKTPGDVDMWLPVASSVLPRPEASEDRAAFMTLSVDGGDEAGNRKVDPFILEAKMSYHPEMDQYEFVVDDVGVNLDGRDLMISTDEGGAYSVRIR